MRILCFPYAGGTAPLFYSWERHLPAEIQVCPVELPGRGGRINDVLPGSIPELVGQILDEAAAYFDRPVSLFGHSLGALISFELARALRHREMPAPARLFISAACAPHIPRRRAPIHHLDDAEFIHELGKMNGTPNEVLMHQELLSVLLPALRADFQIAETYKYVSEQPLTCPITAIGGTEDELITRGNLVAWHYHTTGLFNLRMVAGAHFFLKSQGSNVARIIANTLAERQPV